MIYNCIYYFKVFNFQLKNRNLKNIIIFLFFIAINPNYVFANVSKEVIDDWTIVCSNSDKEVCNLIQNLVNDKNLSVLSLQVSSLGTAKNLVISTPIGVSIPPGLVITFKDKSYRIQYQSCTNLGCDSIVKINEENKEILEYLRNSNIAKVQITAIDNKKINFNVSLKGFKKAFEKLK